MTYPRNNNDVAILIAHIRQDIYMINAPHYGYNYTGDIFTETDYNNNITWDDPLETIPWSEVEAIAGTYIPAYEWANIPPNTPELNQMRADIEDLQTRVDALENP